MQLLNGIEHAAPVREALATVSYVPGHVAIHGDMSVLPQEEEER